MDGLKELLAKHKEKELTENQFEDELKKILPKEWKPAETYNQLSEKYKTLEKQNAEYAKAIEEANKNKSSLEDLNKKFDALKAEHKAELDKKEKEFAQYKKNSFIDGAIEKAGAKTVKAVRALIDTDKVVPDNNGSFLGLEEQLKAIKENKETSYLFSGTDKDKPNFKNGGGDNTPVTDARLKEIRAAFGLT